MIASLKSFTDFELHFCTYIEVPAVETFEIIGFFQFSVYEVNSFILNLRALVKEGIILTNILTLCEDLKN